MTFNKFVSNVYDVAFWIFYASFCASILTPKQLVMLGIATFLFALILSSLSFFGVIKKKE